MKNILIPFIVILFVFFLAFSWVGGTYNTLVSDRVAVQTQQGQIEAQLQRRFDLVPNLVASVKGAMSQEQKVFKDIADARTHYAGVSAGTPEKIQAANQFDSAVSRLLVVMENYPDLKSTATVQDLMTELEGTENRISVARQRYNESVQIYDQQLQIFPTNIIGGMFHFLPYPMYQSVSGAQNAPKVDFTK